MLDLSENLVIEKEVFRNFERNKAFRDAHPDFPLPPIAIMVDAHSVWDYEEYAYSGKKAARIIADVAKRHLWQAGPASVYEWGCGPARILRHMPEFMGPGNSYHGSDYNRASIEWCQGAIPNINFFVNGLEANLPVADNSYDLTFCRSVFTHLSEQIAKDWMAELTRVTKPDGIICFTTQSEGVKHKLTDAERGIYDAGGMVERSNAAEGQRDYSAFHPPAYVENILLRSLSLVEHMPQRDTQDVWVARVPH